ncbi:TrkA-N domain protein [Magnetococcus marinus MC-1]|uniref:TrkA-N domain protein n=1 Tax=Magnetococcus marinus (strain ATCC BAA-1437 / JCM 17883 / MC-1) TaxID=156889 RepID=A0LA65_MAGMM|nr:potassium channel protein [Magnetococcus marinus]ABK44858.1 TrkA-N domain protein [Magnetococcus marinus MC-1]
MILKSIYYQIFRRMRFPLLLLLGTYAIAILGMTLIPGVDDQGNPWKMSFFHATYYVSYMATTIGFGEIPYPFSEAQRLWGIFCIYLNVISWLYAIGSIINIMQDAAFRRALVELKFSSMVRHLGEPFYILCGFGDTGTALVRALTNRGIYAVVLDQKEAAINRLNLTDYQLDVPALYGDATMPDTLKLAGLEHPRCKGVVAMTDKDEVNLKIAITSKLLNPKLPVICRGERPDYEENMASFGTDHIIDPYLTFSSRLSLALDKPGVYTLYNWLAAISRAPLPDPIFPPKGKWVLCGFGQFGQAMHARLTTQGITVVTVEVDPEGTHSPPGSIQGWGTDHDTLHKAGIETAVGLVAGTENDTNNLSIVMTALEMNPNLFVVTRENRRYNRELFQKVGADLVMQSSEILAREVRLLLTLPLVRDFLREVEKMDNEWANQTVSRIAGIAGETVPDVWDVEINATQTPAIILQLDRGQSITLAHVQSNPRQREHTLPMLALFIRRSDGSCMVLPPPACPLFDGDRVLFCGDYGIKQRMQWTLYNDALLNYVISGDEQRQSWLMRKFRA